MALNKGDIYTCAKKSQLEVLMNTEGCAELVCCGEPMTKLEPKTADAKTEKHVPVVEAIPGGVKVTVGSTLHPMKDEHYIEWIEVRTADRVYKKYLKPGDEPVATFQIEGTVLVAREHCNVHGLWAKA